MADLEQPSLLGDAAAIRGNTKTILISLYKSFMDIPNVPDDNSALNRAVILNMHTAKLGIQLESAPKLLPESDVIQSGLEKLKAINTTPTKQSYEIYNKQFNPFVEKVTTHAHNLDDILTAYQQIIMQQHEHIKAILQKIDKAKDQKDMTGSQPIQRELANQETKVKELRHRLGLLIKTGAVTETELSSLHRLIYNAIPAAERKTLVSPDEIARARRNFAQATEDASFTRPSLGSGPISAQ